MPKGYEDNNLIAGHGKKPNQKLKPYVVLQYLLKYTDENNTASALDIVEYLKECGIYAERRSVYRDIEDINKVMWMIENETDIYEAEEVIATDEDNTEKLVVYDKHKKGFYVRQRHFDLNDIRLLAECVYSAKFIAQGQADRLTDVVCDFVSEAQAKKIRHDAFLTDRVKTTNKSVLNSIATINEAMSTELDGQPHAPEKISFYYLGYTLNGITLQQKERHNGELYIVSPFKLIINDGNYYLMAYDAKSQIIKNYRVDRMKNVKPVGEPREGKEVFAEIDIESYTRRVFSMFGGSDELITIQFTNNLLDTVVDRFGTEGITYRKTDAEHFTISTHVEISKQFFSWVCGFGAEAEIISPPSAIEAFKKFLESIQNLYKSC